MPLAPARGSVLGGVLVIYRACLPALRGFGRCALVGGCAPLHSAGRTRLRCAAAAFALLPPPLPPRRARVARCAAPPFPPLWSARRRAFALWAARRRAVTLHFVSLRFAFSLFSIPLRGCAPLCFVVSSRATLAPALSSVGGKPPPYVRAWCFYGLRFRWGQSPLYFAWLFPRCGVAGASPPCVALGLGSLAALARFA